MSCNYFVSAQKPTAVLYTATGNFTGPDDLNLIVAKASELDIHLVTEEGLRLVQQVPIFGRISIVKLFRPKNEPKDLLLVLTAKYQVCVLEYNTTTGQLVTRAHGNVADKIGRPAETGVIVAISPDGMHICLRLYDGLLKIIEWQSESRELRAENVRFDDFAVVDILFLEACESPTIVYIYNEVLSNQQCRRHLKTVGFNFEDHEFVNGPWKQPNVEAEASLILPVCAPFGGCLLIGQESISYHRGEGDYVAVAPPLINQSTIVCSCRIESKGLRYLLGDMAGRLFALVLEADAENTKIVAIKVEYLGETTIPERLEYLDNGVVFVGSRIGDSQLIRLNSEPIEETGCFVQVLESFTNLGPICDMVLVDMDNQAQLVTCSGAFKEGSLRIIRNGIGINELATIDLPGIKGIWALSYGVACPQGEHNLLLLAFVGQTSALLLNEEEVEQVNIQGIPQDEQCLWASNAAADGQQYIILVTGRAVRLLSAAEGRVLSQWTPGDAQQISVVAGNAQTRQIVVAQGAKLQCLSVDLHAKTIDVSGETTLDYEIACIDIAAIGESSSGSLCAVGLWSDISVRLLTLPDLQQVHREPLGGEILARSVLMCEFEQTFYLLVALGDGTLYYYVMDTTTGALNDRKKVTLGTQPVMLHRFSTQQSTDGGNQSAASSVVNVFACADRPAVVYSSNQKLIFANVNLKLVTRMCELNASAYRHSLAMSDGQTLMIGTVDDIQKLHIRTVPLGETPRRIAHQPETHTFGVISWRHQVRYSDEAGAIDTRPSASTLAAVSSSSTMAGAPTVQPRSSTNPAADEQAGAIVAHDSEESEVNSLLVIDQNTFEVQHAHQLGPNEMAQSLLSCSLGDDPATYYVVGTAIINPDESEARLGRLIVFQYVGEGKLNYISERDLKGSPYSLAVLNGKLLVAVNSSVRLYEWLPEKELRLECSHFNYTVALYLKTRGDFAVIGDLQRSINVLTYKPLENTFEECARHYRPNWTTAVEMIDDSHYVVAENAFNVFTCMKDTQAAVDDERQQLKDVGLFHVGQMINVFRHGSLVMQPSTAESGAQPLSAPVLFATVDGGVGMIAQCEPALFTLVEWRVVMHAEQWWLFLHELEQRLEACVPSLGRLEHSVWRQWCTERSQMPVNAFVDGDLIEALLDLGRDELDKVCNGLQLPAAADDGMRKEATPDELLKIVEDLSRTH